MSQALLYIADHVQRALDRRTQAFRGTVAHAAIIAAIANQVQGLEDAGWRVLSMISIDASEGLQLDNLGAILGAKRQGWTDPQYRAFLRATVLVNKSSGTMPQLLRILVTVLAAFNGHQVVAKTYAPGCVRFRIVGALGAVSPIVLNALLQKAKAAGVRVQVEWSAVSVGETFTLDVGPGLDVGHLAGILG